MSTSANLNRTDQAYTLGTISWEEYNISNSKIIEKAVDLAEAMCSYKAYLEKYQEEIRPKTWVIIWIEVRRLGYEPLPIQDVYFKLSALVEELANSKIQSTTIPDNNHQNLTSIIKERKNKNSQKVVLSLSKLLNFFFGGKLLRALNLIRNKF